MSLSNKNNSNPSFIQSPVRNILLIILLGLVYACSTVTPPVTSEQGMVASAHPAATEVGVRVLQAGGNAVDAATATAFALAVVEPYASGLGGGGFLTIKPKDGNAVTIDFREEAPSGVTDQKYYSDSVDFKNVAKLGPLSIGVPGELAAYDMALKKYGTMKLKDVLKYATQIARKGFPASETLHNITVEEYEVLADSKELSELYLPGGMPVEVGDTIKNEPLAEAFDRISSEGIKAFYEGKIAKEISEKSNGNITTEDLKNYKPLLKDPVIGYYKGYEIVTSAPPSGGAHLIELLNILENFNLKELGHNSAEYINILAKAIKLVQTDKSNFSGDPAFVHVPVSRIIDKEYAKKAADFIAQSGPGFEWRGKDLMESESGSTTSFTIVDKDGTLVSATQSINHFYGSGVVANGILLNDHLDNFDDTKGNNNSITPGKRPVSSISPTVILKDGKPFLTVGTPGGSRIIGSLAQIIVNLVDFDMPLEEAINAPRIHQTKTVLHLEGGIKKEVKDSLEEKGFKISMHKENDKYFGGAQAIMIDSKTNKLIGAADIRRGGSAKGYASKE